MLGPMDILETPESRFENLADYPFVPHFFDVDAQTPGLRMHYVDEGPRSGPVVLLLHGEPSWSYLYRSMIPPLVAAGCRVIAPDLIGFGKSSKPGAISDHSYAAHCAWVGSLVEGLELADITLFAQDWGALIGLRLVAEMRERFGRVAIGNGFLPEGKTPGGSIKGLANIATFMTWRTFALHSPWFVMSSILNFGTGRTLSAEERRAYDAPFPDADYLSGPRAMPGLVPLLPSDPAAPANRAAWRVLESWQQPFLTLFSTGDPITAGMDRLLQRRIPGAKDMPHTRVRGGHFLQEDSGPELADHLVALVERSRD
jgi:haloalkane dehalogenase